MKKLYFLLFVVLAFAKLVSQELTEYITKNVSFPNSMVDRITPVTSPENIENIKRDYGIIDEWPVVCEPFLQWVIEDKFSRTFDLSKV